MHRVGSRTGTYRHGTRYAGKLPGSHLSAQLVSHTQRVFRGGLRQQNGKLLTAIAANYVDFSQLLRKH